MSDEPSQSVSDPDARPEDSEKETPEDSPRDEETPVAGADDEPGDESDAAEEAFTQDPDQVDADREPTADDFAALERRVVKLTDENDKVRDLARRLKADYDNLLRRGRENEKLLESQLTGRICAEFLPVLDDLHRAAAEANRSSGETADEAGGEPAPASPADEALRTGVGLVLRRFEETLAKQGLSEIEALGRPFDPRWHEAVHRRPAAAGEQDEEVVEVYRRGYLRDGRVIRSASVVVAIGLAPEEAAAEEATEEPSADSPAEPAEAEPSPEEPAEAEPAPEDAASPSTSSSAARGDSDE